MIAEARMQHNASLVAMADKAPLSTDARHCLVLAIFNDLVTGIFTTGAGKSAYDEWWIDGSSGGHDFFITAWDWESVHSDVLDGTYVQRASVTP